MWTQLEDDVSGTTYTEDAAAIAQAGNNPYYYGIRAHNEEGAGDWSAYPSIDLELNDIRPHNISVTGDTDSRTITWDKPDGYTPSRYGITRGSTSLSTSHTSTSYTDNTDLSPGTYTYVIGGYDASGDYAEATGVSIVVSDTVTAPGVPTSVSAVAASTTSIYVHVVSPHIRWSTNFLRSPVQSLKFRHMVGFFRRHIPRYIHKSFPTVI